MVAADLWLLGFRKRLNARRQRQVKKEEEEEEEEERPLNRLTVVKTRPNRPA
jgi:hypothetical protein